MALLLHFVEKFVAVISPTQQAKLYLDILLSTGMETAEVVILFQDAEGAFHLDGAVHPVLDSDGGGNVPGRISAEFFKNRREANGFIGSLPAPVTLLVEGTAAAVFAEVRPIRPLISGLCLPLALVRKTQMTAVLTNEVVLLRVVKHVFFPADFLIVFLSFLGFMVLGFDERLVAILLEIGIVFLTFITRIGHNILVGEGMLFLCLPKEGDESGRVISVRKDAEMDDVFCFNPNLQVVSGLQLTIPHVVVFQPHESSVGIGLGIAIAVFSHDGQLCVVTGFPLHIAFQLLIIPLECGFFLPFPMDEWNARTFHFLLKEKEVGLQSFKSQRKWEGVVWKASLKQKARFLCHPFLGFLDLFPPDKRVAVRICFHFGSIHIKGFKGDLSPLPKELDELGVQILQRMGKPFFLEAGNGIMIGNVRFPLQQVKEMEIPATGFFQLPAGVDLVHLAINDNFEKILR